MNKEKTLLKTIFFLQLSIIVFSFSGVFQKYAAKYKFLSFNNLLFYGLSFFILFVYAFLWQKILKKVPLSVAYANRATAMIWSLAWSYLMFGENIGINKIFGSLIICYGVYRISVANE